ncbi:MAG: DUF4129 domain-containing protein, partial [Actinobacteria bacterium]|nr:DUF4129 domain-containing protein [Actinomycetota bacterium]
LATTPAQTVSTTVTLALGQGTPLYLPVPYAPVKLKLPGRTATPGWAEMAGTLMLYNNELPELGALPYTVTSTETNPKPTDITAATETMPNYIANQYGFYNGPDRDQLLAIVNQHIGRAQTSLERALLLQTWLLSGSFRYSVNPKLPSTHWLRTFLTTRKRGYCQQFAWAFAVLARLAGIPSRIAVGYTAGTRGPDGKWRVSTADAHAWPELYFPGEGWLRFEPTPHGTTGQGTATVPTYATGNPAGGPGSLTPNGQPTAGAVGGRPPANPAGQQKPSIGLPGGFGGSPAAAAGSWIAVGLPIVALLLLLSPALARRLTRRRRWLAASGDAATAVAAWRELSDDLTDYGLARGPGETPRTLARRLSREASLDQPSEQALRRIVTAAERATYARLAQPSAGLTADVTRVRRAVASTVSVRKRIRAWLLPASTLALVQDGLQRAGDRLSWLDTSWPALRRQAPRPALRRQAP